MATANLLIFTIIPGDDPRQTTGTRISLILSDRDVDKKWGAWIRKNEEKMLSVRINTPPTCYVGVWKLQVETIKKADNKNIIFEYTHDQDIYVLFNPWCEGLFFLLFCACKANLMGWGEVKYKIIEKCKEWSPRIVKQGNKNKEHNKIIHEIISLEAKP